MIFGELHEKINRLEDELTAKNYQLAVTNEMLDESHEREQLLRQRLAEVYKLLDHAV